MTNRSVVNVNTRFESHDRFFPMIESRGEGAGSGSVIDKQGHILTNYHVVEDAQEISVTMYDSKPYPATLVGYDADHDIAILKIEAQPTSFTRSTSEPPKISKSASASTPSAIRSDWSGR